MAVDIRKGSPTFSQHVAIELTEENKKQFFVPRGFAHGFIVLSAAAIFSYKCDNYYNKSSEEGILYNDPSINIDWNFPESQLIISKKDKDLPTFETLFK